MITHFRRKGDWKTTAPTAVVGVWVDLMAWWWGQRDQACGRYDRYTQERSTFTKNMSTADGFREKLLAVESKVEREVLLLQRRWGSNMKMEGSDPLTFSIQLQPTDPQFPYDIGDGLSLRFELPSGYPEQHACKVSVINDNLTQEIRTAIEKGVAQQAKQLEGDLMIRSLLKWIDNCLTLLFECALAVAAKGPAQAKEPEKPSEDKIQNAPSTEIRSDSAPDGSGGEDKAAGGAVWTADQQSCLEKALKDFPASMDTSERWKKIAEAVPGKSKKECVARFKELKQALQSGGAAKTDEPEAQREEAKSKKSGDEAAREWTDAQQGALEEALREFPASEGVTSEERWQRIAGRVPGRSARECALRYQSIKQQLRAQLDLAQKELAKSKAAAAKEKEKAAGPMRSFKFSIEPQETPKTEALKTQSSEDEQAEQEQEEEGTIRLGAADSTDDDDDQDEEGEGDEHEEEEKEEEGGCGDEGAAAAKKIRPLGMEGGPDGKVCLTGHHRGLQLRFGDLLLAGVGVAQLGRARVLLQCTKCSLRSEPTLSRHFSVQVSWAGACERCKQEQRAAFRPDVMHAQRGSAGYLDVEGLAVADLLPSTLWVSCEECGAEATLSRMRRGRREEVACRECHAKMLVGFNDVTFVKVGPTAQASAGAGQKKASRDKELVLVPGQPLPNRGACEHYKRSLRWLRFPCCGRAYACDICHEKDGCEPGVWANRMICGLCSTETGYSNKDCGKCGNAMSSGGNKTHWEGGKGCRNKNMMSNKDSKKFSNSKYKTVSRKAQREAASK